LFNSEIQLIGSDTKPDDRFAVSVATNGSTAIIGAYADDNFGLNSGSVYIFDVATGSELFKLSASDAGPGYQFGVASALSGNRAIIGAPTALNDNGVISGAAYLIDVTTGSQLHKLTSGTGASIDYFGISVSISNNTAIVGAMFDSSGSYQSGAAYLFDVFTGEELLKLKASDATSLDLFGSSVAISGNVAIVGAAADNVKGNRSGSAYLFEVSTGKELFKLAASDGTVDDYFGSRVAISGNIAVVAAGGKNNSLPGSGAVYVFDTKSGSEIFKLTPSDPQLYSGFGSEVAISGNIAIVGAFETDVAGRDSGAVYLFDLTTGHELMKLLPSDASEYGYFGSSLAAWDNTIVVGANHNFSGKAYIFGNTIVPEPSSLFLAIVGMGVLSRFRMRHDGHCR
jgi:hypothetical protein